MKVRIGIGGAASGQRRDFDQLVEYVVEAEKLGVDTVWTAEAWGQDAIAPLAYLAARTSRIRLGTGIMQISSRVPASARDDSANDGRNKQRSLHPGPWHERSASCRRVAGSVIQSAANQAQRNRGDHQAGVRWRKDRVPR